MARLTSHASRSDRSRTYACVKLPFAQITRSWLHFDLLNRENGRAIQLSLSLQPLFSALSHLLSQVNIGVNFSLEHSFPSMSFFFPFLSIPLSGSQQMN